MFAVHGFDVVDHVAVDADLAVGDHFEAGDHPQQRRLAATGRADDDDEFTVGMSMLTPWMTSVSP